LHAHAAALRLPSSFFVASPGGGAGFEHQRAAAAWVPASIGRRSQRRGGSFNGSRGSWEGRPQTVRSPRSTGRKPLGHLFRFARVARRVVVGGARGSEPGCAGAVPLLAPPSAGGLPSSRSGAVVAFDGSPSRGMLK
jgi:hypothetical protein